MADSYDSYDFRRAEFEMDMARKAADPAVMRVHQELAALYLERFTAATVTRMKPSLPRGVTPQATGRLARSAWASVPSSR